MPADNDVGTTATVVDMKVTPAGVTLFVCEDGVNMLSGADAASIAQGSEQ